MWNEVFVENSLKDHPRINQILNKIDKVPIYVDKYDDYWGKSKKPYLQKRDNLNLYLAKKQGTLIKLAPDAYGTLGDPHYYFIHAFNCIYECEYCYLQGHFSTPDIVLFINHEEIIHEMNSISAENKNKTVWFHAGEFSDSLALSHITGELDLYHEFCKLNPNAKIELRTKSVNIKSLEKLNPINNLITSFSLSPHETARRIDLKTPGTRARISAIKKLKDRGHPIALHFDPIIYTDDFKDNYQSLIDELADNDLLNDLEYLSLGVVRFTKDVYREVERNYPDSYLHTTPFIKGFDNKVRYNKPLRMWMMNTIKEKLINSGLDQSKVYLCMENQINETP